MVNCTGPEFGQNQIYLPVQWYYPLKKLSPCPKMKIWTGLPQGHLAPNRRYKEVLVPVATLWCRQYKGLLQSKQEAIKSWHHSYSWLQIFKFVFGLNSQLGLCTLAPSLRVCHRAGSLIDWYWANWCGTRREKISHLEYTNSRLYAFDRNVMSHQARQWRGKGLIGEKREENLWP